MSRRALSRQVQAFDALLEPDHDDEQGTKKRTPKNKSRPYKPGQVPIPSFRLRGDSEHANDQATASSSRRQRSAAPDQQEDAIARLEDLVAGALPREVIADVFQACDRSLEAATEALLAMTLHEAAPRHGIGDVDREAVPTGAGAGLDHRADHVANVPSFTSTCTSPSTSFWHVLPRECKDLVFQHLGLLDKATAARTCRDFAQHVASERRSLSVLRLPPGRRRRFDPGHMRSIVSAFSRAHTVHLHAQFSSENFKHLDEFERFMAAIAAGAQARASSPSVVASSTSLPGSAGSAKGEANFLPVDTLMLDGCHVLTDSHVDTLCSTLRTLRCLHLNGCVEIGDASLAALARYRRETVLAQRRTRKEGRAHAATAAIDDAEQENTSQPSSSSSSYEVVGNPAASVDRIVADVRTARAAFDSANSPSSSSLLLLDECRGGIEELLVARSKVTDKGVQRLLKGSSRAPSLRVLDVSRTAVSGAGIVPGPRGHLQVLRANACSLCTSVLMHLPLQHSSLLDLSLADCENLRSVSLIAPRLKSLNVSGCIRLTSLHLQCPKLEVLKAAKCKLLTCHDVEALSCPSLRQVSFHGCRSMDTASLESILPSLRCIESLDLSGCSALGRLIAARGDGLPRLSRLCLDGCTVLRTVDVRTGGCLKFVSAKGCSRLMQLSLPGALPLVLNLENCVELREALLGCEDGVATSGIQPQRDVRDTSANDRYREQDRWQQCEIMSGSKDQGETQPKAQLVLRGTDHLPDATKLRLRAVILGSKLKS
jgi:hypothetical protein